MNRKDILNRDDFIVQLINVVNNISINKLSVCFAINGKWGCGKTFVLDMFESQLEKFQSEETAKDKYFIIRYNSWSYDYYEEPLIAIVSSIILTIENKTKLFPDSEKKQEILGILKEAGTVMFSIFNGLIKEKIGIDVKDTIDIVKNGKEKGIGDYAKKHEYDYYFALKKVMKDLSNVLQKITEEYTVVFLVDELDRCIPKYGIKVLERLHHLTENQKNIITIIAMDKEQLKSSIQQIFGFKDVDKYLGKFISFEVKLDYGTVSEAIVDKYNDYIQLFDKELFPFDDSIEEFLQVIFKDIDIRTQEQIVKKAMIAHTLLYQEKKDYSFMCMELLLVVLISVYKDRSCFSNEAINVDSYDNIFISRLQENKPVFANFFKQKFECIPIKVEHGCPDEPVKKILINKANLYGAILFTWYWLHKTSPSVIYKYLKGTSYEIIALNYKDLKKFIEMIRMIS